jgi:hypothetical protein
MAAPKSADERAERRRQVAALMLRKKTQRQMAAALGVSLQTINADVAAVRAEWQASRLDDADATITEELATLAVAQDAIWDQVEQGRAHVIDRLLAIMDRRAKYLGLDAPAKTQETGGLTIRVEYADADAPPAA